MLRWAHIFLVVALIVGFMGFIGNAGESMRIAEILFFAFPIVFIVGYLSSPVTGRRARGA